jgi:hypothetical protein
LRLLTAIDMTATIGSGEVALRQRHEKAKSGEFYLRRLPDRDASSDGVLFGRRLLEALGPAAIHRRMSCSIRSSIAHSFQWAHESHRLAVNSGCTASRLRQASRRVRRGRNKYSLAIAKFHKRPNRSETGYTLPNHDLSPLALIEVKPVAARPTQRSPDQAHELLFRCWRSKTAGSGPW